MTKPNITAIYPTIQAAAAAALARDPKHWDARDVTAFYQPHRGAAKVAAILEAGQCTVTEAKDAREYINRLVSGAFKLLIGNVYLNQSERDDHDLADLVYYSTPREARLIPGYLKKLQKTKIKHDLITRAIELSNELMELTEFVEWTKTVTYKANVKAAAEKKTKLEEQRIKNDTDVVYQSVLPLKVRAQEEAELRTREYIAKLVGTSTSFDLDIVAPAGAYKVDSEIARRSKDALRAFWYTFCKIDYNYQTYQTTATVVPSKIEELVADARKQAAAQFEIYVAKLNQKINDETLKATLTTYGNVWCESTLEVVTKNKGTQVWHTQIIVNFSKYGRAFNQFPTRLK